MVDERDAAVRILNEREIGGGLAFLVAVVGSGRSIELRLNWADYNLWSPDGADAPERVAEAVAREALARHGDEELPDPLDAARLRRRWPEADAAIAARLRRFG